MILLDSQLVYDVADPNLHGRIINAGSQQSEVRFDDGVSRIVSNAHLRSVPTLSAADDNGLSHLNPSLDVVRLGQEAMERKRRAWPDWLAIAEALQFGRTEVMRALHTNETTGRRFEKAMGEWLIVHQFKEIDKGTRSRLLECLKHKAEIEKWRALLTDSQRFAFNHPDTVLRKWKASIVVPDPNAASKPSPMQNLKDELVGVIEERDRLIRAGGDLWTPEDRPRDIAKVILGKLTKVKAEKVAHEILNALRAECSGGRVSSSAEVDAALQNWKRRAPDELPDLALRVRRAAGRGVHLSEQQWRTVEAVEAAAPALKEAK